MKYYLLLFAFLFQKISCDPELQDSLDQIQKLKGGSELIAEVLKEGPIRIQNEPGLRFGGYWDPNIRAVVMDGGANPIYTLIFELHNASAQKQFDQVSDLASRGMISRDQFIRDFEWIEYQNTFKTTALVAQGIQEGLFPEEAQTIYSSNFEEHLRIQKRAGHSERLGQFYDLLIS